MKKLFTLLLVLAAITFSSCGILSELLDSETLNTILNPGEVAESVSVDDYIHVDNGSVRVPASKAGKTAYLVKVNLGASKVKKGDTGYSRSISDSESEVEYYRTKTFDPGITRESLGELISEEEASRSVSRAAKTYSKGDTKSFYLAEKTSKTATLKAVSNNFYIWYVPSNKKFIKESELDFATLGSKLDSIFSMEKAIFGSNVPKKNYSNVITITESDKIHVVVYDIQDDAKEGTYTGLFGLMSTSNMIVQEGSNQCQLLYLDSYLFQEKEEEIWLTAAHELQHLLNFVQKQLNIDATVNSFSTWSTEMLSLLAEEIFQEKLGVSDEYSVVKTRSVFLNAGLNIGFGEEAWDWASSSSGRPGSFEYANTYLFGTYLARNFGGIKLIHEIATNSYYKEEAITQALKTCGYDEDFASVLAKFGQTFVNYDNKGSICTLDKTISSTYSGTTYKFKAMNISDYKVPASAFSNEWKSLVSNGTIPGLSQLSNYSSSSSYVSYPMYLKSTSEGSVQLFQYGTSVHCIGKVPSGGTTYRFNEPGDDDVVMFVSFR